MDDRYNVHRLMRLRARDAISRIRYAIDFDPKAVSIAKSTRRKSDANKAKKIRVRIYYRIDTNAKR